jgi:AraC-like DNA-binding protein
MAIFAKVVDIFSFASMERFSFIVFALSLLTMIVCLNLNPRLDGAVWYHQYRGPKLRKSERHRELEFNFVVKGTATYLIKNQKFVLVRNSNVWLFPGQEHMLINESVDCEMWIVVFRRRLLQRICREQQFRLLSKSDPVPDFCRRLSVPSAQQLHALLQSIFESAKIPAFFNSGLAFTLHKAWLLSCEEQPVVPVCDVHPCVERAAYLLQQEDPQMTTKEICRTSGLSTSRLRRLFKIQTGLGIHEFRNRVMIDRFVQLYSTRKDKMLSTALQAGFGSYSQFHRVFTKAMGRSPGRYYRSTSELTAPSPGYGNP